jgi:hypothetical protein
LDPRPRILQRIEAVKLLSDFITESLPIEVSHAARLEAKYAKGKPIRRITIKDLGGEDRHAVRPNAKFVPTLANKEAADTKRRELARQVIAYLRANGPTRSSDLSRLFDANALRIGMAVRGLVNIKSGVASGDREKTYWLVSNE